MVGRERGEFIARARGFGVDVAEAVVERLELYWERLTAAAAVLDLVGPAKLGGNFAEEMLDALAPLGVAELAGGGRVLDVGSGGGLPGVPVAICRPDLSVTLLDANRRKAAFLSDVVWALELDDCRVVSERAEVWGHMPGERGSYDLVLARGVAALPVLLELTLPFVRVGGLAVLHKGPGLEEERAEAGKAVALLGGSWRGSWWYEPGRGVRRALFVVRKVAATPAAYPRRSGIPARRPLV